MAWRRVPRFLHALTGFHAAGALACFVIASGSAVSESLRRSLAVSRGSTFVVEVFGAWTSAFPAFVGTVVAYAARPAVRRA